MTANGRRIYGHCDPAVHDPLGCDVDACTVEHHYGCDKEGCPGSVPVNG
jgi:hypothetical protein